MIDVREFEINMKVKDESCEGYLKLSMSTRDPLDWEVLTRDIRLLVQRAIESDYVKTSEAGRKSLLDELYAKLDSKLKDQKSTTSASKMEEK